MVWWNNFPRYHGLTSVYMASRTAQLTWANHFPVSSRNSAFIVCVVRALSHGQFDCHDQGNDYSCHRQVGAVLVCSDLSQLRDLQLALALRRVSSAKCCSHLSLHSPHFQTYRNFLHMLHVAMAQSCFYYSAVCYVGLPFVTTSCFHIIGHSTVLMLAVDWQNMSVNISIRGQHLLVTVTIKSLL